MKNYLIKIISLMLAVILTFGLTACGGDTNDAVDNDNEFSELEAVELIAADSTAKGAAGQIWGEYFSERVEELTSGKLTIDYHPNGDLGGDSDLLRQAVSGDIDIVVCQTAPVVSFVPEMAVFDLPMAFAKYDGATIDKALNGDNEFTHGLREAYENQGLSLLGFLQNGTYRLTTADRALNTLEDFKGLQIRTMENQNHMAFWQAIGAEPTPLAWAEVYIALQNGTIEAQENAADTCAGSNFQEVQDYLCLTNHILYCNQMCINKATFDSLDPLYQEAIETAITEANTYVSEMLEKLDEENKQLLEDGGMTIIEYDDSFFDEILALDGVQALYKAIDEQTKGLAEKLQKTLAS